MLVFGFGQFVSLDVACCVKPCKPRVLDPRRRLRQRRDPSMTRCKATAAAAGQALLNLSQSRAPAATSITKQGRRAPNVPVLVAFQLTRAPISSARRPEFLSLYARWFESRGTCRPRQPTHGNSRTTAS